MTHTDASHPRQVEFIAHRGESADAPENTMAAFRLAWDRGVPAFELDVRLTADNELIVCHDGDTRRTTGVPRMIADSHAADLRALDAGAWKGQQWAGERLPLLAEVLDELPAGVRCFVEVKVGPEAAAPVADALRSAGTPADQVVVISFNAGTVAEARRQMPTVRTYLLSSFRREPPDGDWRPTAEKLIEDARAIRTQGLSLCADGPVDDRFARDAHAAGLDLYVWTIDDVPTALRFLAAGVDGITSNRAAWLREQCQSAAGAVARQV